MGDYFDNREDSIVEILQTNLMNLDNLAGAFYPPSREAGGSIDEQQITEPNSSGHVLPPEGELRHWYGNDEQYIETSQQESERIKDLAERDGFKISGGRVLEFGCSSGRLIRQFDEAAKLTDCWGVDIHAEAISWAQDNLSPQFNFATCTTAPHLPFRDGYFGFIFATSVFTHIGALDDAWLLELKRILDEDGRIYITILDDLGLKTLENFPTHQANQLLDSFHAETDVLNRPFKRFTYRSTPWERRVIYQRRLFLKKVSAWFDVVEVDENVHNGWQTGILLRPR